MHLPSCRWLVIVENPLGGDGGVCEGELGEELVRPADTNPAVHHRVGRVGSTQEDSPVVVLTRWMLVHADGNQVRWFRCGVWGRTCLLSSRSRLLHFPISWWLFPSHLFIFPMNILLNTLRSLSLSTFSLCMCCTTPSHMAH